MNERYLKGLTKYMKGSMRNFVDRMFPALYGTKFNWGHHHKEICAALDEVVQGKCRKLIINIAPRYGKTELVSRLFINYGFAVNPASKFINLSYSANLVEGNSTAVKETIRHPLFRKLFGVEIDKRRKNAKNEWYTTAGGGLYVASSQGQVTGFGAGATDSEDDMVSGEKIDEYTEGMTGKKFAGALIIDDPLKPDDALSDRIREHINELFETTIRNRVNSRNTPIIVIMQRLHEHDICGYLQDMEGTDPKTGGWKVISLPCIQVDKNGKEKPLWPLKHTLKELHKIEERTPFVFLTQYQQNPTPKEGLMYTRFRTYETLPVGRYIVKNYTDTADDGNHYTVSVDYAEFEKTGECYLLDNVCTDKGMEYTEPEVARMLDRDKVAVANIESNNGGKGFSRNVERNLRLMGNTKTRIVWFTQRLNKASRILSHSAEVENLLYYPADWDVNPRWAKLHSFAVSYRKAGRNARDDVPDVLTGIVEKRAVAVARRVSVGRY